jgi:hypothetical protein
MVELRAPMPPPLRLLLGEYLASHRQRHPPPPPPYPSALSALNPQSPRR